jgi:hypothetical protein
MKTYHQVWLDAHPRRTPEWLAAVIDEGFEVHHIDGDRENNTPENLVLVEELDHSMLHRDKRNLSVTKKQERGMKPETIKNGRAAYEARAEGHRWNRIPKIIGVKYGYKSLMVTARRYAKENNKPWPTPLPPNCPGHIGKQWTP